MFDNAERKMMRLNSRVSDEVSASVYNLIIGATLAYGLILNAVIVMNFSEVFMRMNPWVLIIGYFVSCIAGIFIANGSDNPVVSFIGYNLVVLPIGALLSVSVPTYYVEDIISAAMVTGIIVSVMTILATVMPNLFVGMGRTLFISLTLGLVAQIIAMLFGYSGNLFNWFFVIIFTLYVGYDWTKAQSYPKTIDNAVDSSLDIYLDIINLFIRLLAIMGNSKSRR